MRQDGNVVVTVWQDTRPVTFISSGHNPDHTTSVRRKKGDGSIVHVADYNRYMGGVDKGDQYHKYYQQRMKSRKSYKYYNIIIIPINVHICQLKNILCSVSIMPPMALYTGCVLYTQPMWVHKTSL